MKAKHGKYIARTSDITTLHIDAQFRFGEDSVEKMVDWALEAIPPDMDPSPFILEVGAGNGNLLFALHEAGYTPHRMCGVDYSSDAVRLAQAIARSRREAEDDGDTTERFEGDPDAITFAVCDFLQEDVPALPGMTRLEGGSVVWDLVLDKGTFDAMALGTNEDGRSFADGYPLRVGRVVKPGGYFLITCESWIPRSIRFSTVQLNFSLRSMQFHRGRAKEQIHLCRHGSYLPVGR